MAGGLGGGSADIWSSSWELGLRGVTEGEWQQGEKGEPRCLVLGLYRRAGGVFARNSPGARWRQALLRGTHAAQHGQWLWRSDAERWAGEVQSVAGSADDAGVSFAGAKDAAACPSACPWPGAAGELGRSDVEEEACAVGPSSQPEKGEENETVSDGLISAIRLK